MSAEDLNVAVSLKRGISPRIGLDRVALIEAVDELGSISAAAKRLGLSYKGAWDIVQGLNNLFDKPLIEAAPGGKAGGAAAATPRGRAVAAGFRRVQIEVDAALARLEAGISGDTACDLFWSLGMRTSARNALRGEISRVTEGAVTSEVGLRFAEGVEITAVLTRLSVEELGLAVGKPAIALIKSSFVLLAKGEGLKTSARNQIPGEVVGREDGAISSEVTLAIGGGKTITATITLESAQALDIAVGERVTALIKSSHVILAVD
ncbi:TOBE domain-containing protein [Phenylobacterium sp. LjRoot225]|uniref:TOBE domain-containing protein n=1 Tax=Phenylobacterium sp. LjRoot225 TaxID=3342285 RepID=UPI003ECF0401